MIDYYTGMSIILGALGLVIVLVGLKTKSLLTVACGMMPLFAVMLYWSTTLVDML